MEAKQLYLAKFDEINGLGTYMYNEYVNGKQTSNEVKQNVSSILTNMILDGIKIALLQLFKDEEDYEDYLYAFNSDNKVEEILNKKIDDKTFEERIQEHLDKFDGEASIQKVIDTETHRVINATIQEVGSIAKEKTDMSIVKIWETMKDDRVRDTHDYLDGMRVGLNEEFYTYNGDHALEPGGFNIANEDCNCRCWINLGFDEKQG